jgi:hypothetical protein
MGLVLHQPERVAIPPLRAPSQFFLKILILIYFYNFFCLLLLQVTYVTI